jgi:GH43 family beta-xylosidase
LTTPDYAWEKMTHHVNEAPAVLVKNGRVFMTYSASATDASYSLGLLTAAESANLLDPAVWTKSPLPVFRTNAAAGQYGPGHNSFTTTPDGKQDILVYHARNYEKITGDSLFDPNRHTRAQPITWRPDGTPDFGAPVPDASVARPSR